LTPAAAPKQLVVSRRKVTPNWIMGKLQLLAMYPGMTVVKQRGTTLHRQVTVNAAVINPATKLRVLQRPSIFQSVRRCKFKIVVKLFWKVFVLFLNDVH